MAKNVKDNNIELQVTSLEKLEKIAKGQIIALPGFGDGEPFVVRMVRPSMLEMVADSSIPNPLLKTASKLFMKGAGSINEENISDMKGFTELLDVICDRALVEPTMQQLKEIGVKLTDEQKGAILSYVQHGVRALDSFREQSSNTKAFNGVKSVSKKAE